MGDLPRLELLSGLQTLYRTREFADLVLLGPNGIRHNVHRAIACPRSDYIRRAVQERRWHDGKDGHISLVEDDPDIVTYLIEYLYLLDYHPSVTTSTNDDVDESEEGTDVLSIRTDAGDYGTVYGTSAVSAFGGPGPLHSSSSSSSYAGLQRSRTDINRSVLTVHAVPSSGFETYRRSSHQPMPSSVSTASLPVPSPLASTSPDLIVHANVYAAGVRYGIPGLKALALDKYKLQLTRHWNSPEFAESIHVVYNSTPNSERELREAVGDALTWHARLLEKPEIEAAVCEINGLAYELLKRSRRTQPEYHE